MLSSYSFSLKPSKPPTCAFLSLNFKIQGGGDLNASAYVRFLPSLPTHCWPSMLHPTKILRIHEGTGTINDVSGLWGKWKPTGQSGNLKAGCDEVEERKQKNWQRIKPKPFRTCGGEELIRAGWGGHGWPLNNMRERPTDSWSRMGKDSEGKPEMVIKYL